MNAPADRTPEVRNCYISELLAILFSASFLFMFQEHFPHATENINFSSPLVLGDKQIQRSNPESMS
jgi:hypothetical protein